MKRSSRHRLRQTLGQAVIHLVLIAICLAFVVPFRRPW